MADNYALPNRQYVGARYVPKFSDPIEWDINRSYEPLTIVTYLNNSYTSKIPVPVGVEITDEKYWVVTGNYNAQVEDYRQAVEGVKEDMSELQENVNNQFAQKVTYLTPEMFGAKGDGITNDYTALKNMWDYATSIAKDYQMGDTTVKDYRNIKFVFSKLYAIATGWQLSACMNVTLEGLHLVAIGTNIKTALLTLNPVNRYTKLINCHFDGAFGVQYCLLVKGYTINTTMTNCLFKRFKVYGVNIQGTSGGKVQEIRMECCTIEQYDYNDYVNPDVAKEPTGIGIYSTEYTSDNTFINMIIANCVEAILDIHGGPDYILDSHFYSPIPVRLNGVFQVCDNCYMDGTPVEVKGRNSIKNCLFAGTKTSKFIILTEPKNTVWKYEASSFINNQFRNLEGTEYNPNAFTSPNDYELKYTPAYTDANYFEWVTSTIQPNTSRTNLPLLKDFTVKIPDENTDTSGQYVINNMLIQYGTVTEASGAVTFPVTYDYYVPQIIFSEIENSGQNYSHAFNASRSGFSYSNSNGGKCQWIAIGRSNY